MFCFFFQSSCLFTKNISHKVLNTFLLTCSLISNIFTSHVIFMGNSTSNFKLLKYFMLDDFLLLLLAWSLFSSIALCLRWLLVFTEGSRVLRKLSYLFYLFCKVNFCIHSWIRWLWFRVWWNSHHSLSWCWTRQPNSPREVREVCLQWECLQQVSTDLGVKNHWTRQNV